MSIYSVIELIDSASRAAPRRHSWHRTAQEPKEGLRIASPSVEGLHTYMLSINSGARTNETFNTNFTRSIITYKFLEFVI